MTKFRSCQGSGMRRSQPSRATFAAVARSRRVRCAPGFFSKFYDRHEKTRRRVRRNIFLLIPTNKTFLRVVQL